LCPYTRTQTGHGEIRSVEILISDRLLASLFRPLHEADLIPSGY
jgi:hypothetical protein